jgi:hypothetical protein
LRSLLLPDLRFIFPYFVLFCFVLTLSCATLVAKNNATHPVHPSRYPASQKEGG